MNNSKNLPPKLLVIGDLMIDQYLWGDSKRISPEAPVQVVDINQESILLGGAGNVISNLKALGANVDIISVIGNCDIANEINQLLKNIEIDTKYLFRQKNRVTSKKSRIISSKQQVMRFDRESTDEISINSQKLVIDTFKKIVLDYEIILLSDYGKGILTHDLTKSLIHIANKHNKKVLIDPKGVDYSKYNGAYLLTPNKKEASEAMNIDIIDDNSLMNTLIKLKEDCNLEISLVTLSEDGIATYDDKLNIQPTISKEVFDVTGAGDTVLASLGYALALDYDINSAVKFANLAAGVVVGKIGSANTTLEEISEYESRFTNYSINHNIKTFNEIELISNELKLEGKKIVFTNGCFDLLHTGHVRYLETARNFGDVLILGLNSDNSVGALKGKNLPINLELDRAYILSALSAVDYVVIFEDLTPYKLIQAIKPHILVKGGDYKGKNVVGEDLVDELKIVEFIEGKSTSKTIEKIKGIKSK
jgi:D-beta-D-heptose 7-phosphate kinase / D-beta-D-heptose 1-phosphate adenosyltransferase